MSANPSSVFVAGLGATGMSLARFWSARGAQVAVADSRSRPPAATDYEREFPKNAWRQLPEKSMVEAAKEHDLAAVSPGLDPKPFEAAGIAVTSDAECFSQALAEKKRAGDANAPRFVAITGTNGKSTVVSMAADACSGAGAQVAAVGNIGWPLLDALREWNDTGEWPEIVVAELSSFQLETVTALGADVSSVLNLSEDHLDRHGDISDYAAAKAKIHSAAKATVVNRDDPSAEMPTDARNISGFTCDAAKARDGDWVLRENRDGEATLELMGGSSVAAGFIPPLQRRCALAALAVTEPLGLDTARRMKAVTMHPGLPHRMENVGTINGVLFVNDSKATNVAAAAAALKATAAPVVLIAGGVGKGQDFSPLTNAAAQKVSHALLIGRDSSMLATALKNAEVPCEPAECMEDAVARAAAAADGRGTVLLSPACASLDMFEDYRARGRAFADTVRHLAGRKS